jgi:hypothetical protein
MRHASTFALAVLALVACERRDGKLILHEDQVKESAGNAVEKIGEGAEKAGEKTKELGRDLAEGTRDLGREGHEAVDGGR